MSEPKELEEGLSYGDSLVEVSYLDQKMIEACHMDEYISDHDEEGDVGEEAKIAR